MGSGNENDLFVHLCTLMLKRTHMLQNALNSVATCKQHELHKEVANLIIQSHIQI